MGEKRLFYHYVTKLLCSMNAFHANINSFRKIAILITLSSQFKWRIAFDPWLKQTPLSGLHNLSCL